MLCFKAFEGDENATTAGKAELYDLIIENTESQSLINTLATNFMDKGYECMVYCKGVHAAGGNKNKVKVAYAEYASKKASIKTIKTPQELTALVSEMQNCRIDLKDTPRTIPANMFCLDLIEEVENISAEHKRDVRDAIRDLDDQADKESM